MAVAKYYDGTTWQMVVGGEPKFYTGSSWQVVSSVFVQGYDSTSSAGRAVTVSTATELYTALSDAQPGDVITLVDGSYLVSSSQTEAAANGTASQPIILKGSRNAIITTGDNTSGHYGLHVTGDYWQLQGFRVTNCKKGIVMDGAQHVLLDGIEVDTIGQEAVHFRSSSADGIIQNCDIHDTGVSSPQYGEGVYVGSAVSNWTSTYTDPTTGQAVTFGENGGTGPDRSDRCQVLNNHMWNVRAEGCDLKEGTSSGLVQGNLFEACGWTGENSADSAIDVKGTLWTIATNTVSPLLPDGSTPGDTTDPTSAFLDGFQTHVISGSTADSGTNNTFQDNTLVNSIPGYLVRINPTSGTGNVVYDDNTASGAALGVANIPLTPHP